MLVSNLREALVARCSTPREVSPSSNTRQVANNNSLFRQPMARVSTSSRAKSKLWLVRTQEMVETRWLSLSARASHQRMHSISIARRSRMRELQDKSQSIISSIAIQMASQWKTFQIARRSQLVTARHKLRFKVTRCYVCGM